MDAILKISKPLFRALLSTCVAVLAFTGLRHAGLTVETSLIGGLVLAAAMNIQSLASSDPDLLLPG
jgi:hypothetical protein